MNMYEHKFESIKKRCVNNQSKIVSDKIFIVENPTELSLLNNALKNRQIEQ
jgi:hypothetical protein